MPAGLSASMQRPDQLIQAAQLGVKLKCRRLPAEPQPTNDAMDIRFCEAPVHVPFEF